jgi:UDP-N-acetylmuramate--alanine ligase
VLESFTGAKRRFEIKGSYNEAAIVDDYGHHPTEISATIKALGERYPDKKKIVVFWPHQFKRMKALIDDFAKALLLADEVIVKPIYFVPGRDQKLDIESSDLVKLIIEHRKIATFLKTDEEIIQYLKHTLYKNNVLLTIGIPPVYKIADAIVGSDKKE